MASRNPINNSSSKKKKKKPRLRLIHLNFLFLFFSGVYYLSWSRYFVQSSLIPRTETKPGTKHTIRNNDLRGREAVSSMPFMNASMLLSSPSSKHHIIISSATTDEDDNNNNSNNKGMSACLLVMDDNHFLIEWLAYHYHALPLRYLVLAMDPRSQTTPLAILQRWEDMNMTVVTWTDADYLEADALQASEKLVTYHFGPNITADLRRHRARQRLFYGRCLNHIKRAGRDWTVMLDTDEFLRINYDTVQKMQQQQELKQQQQVLSVPSPAEPGAVGTFLRRAITMQGNPNFLGGILSSPCIQIPRRRFGTRESKADKMSHLVPDGYSPDAFQTLHWRFHANDADYGTNRVSKTLLDLSRISWDDLATEVDSIHRPVKKWCKRRLLHIRAPQQALLVHHYLGSWEQYQYRADARWGQERSWEQYEKAQHLNGGRDDAIRPWLQGFVDTLGEEKAHALLENVGVLEPKTKQNE